MHDGNRVVLAIEDSASAREMIMDFLGSAGYVVRMASGMENLESEIKKDPRFAEGIGLMLCDMELIEDTDKYGRRKAVSEDDKKGQHMPGSEIVVFGAMAFPQLSAVPFLIYSGKKPEEIAGKMDELMEYADADPEVRARFRGFLQKGPPEELVSVVNRIFEDPNYVHHSSS